MNLQKTELFKAIEEFNEGGPTRLTVSRFLSSQEVESDEVEDALVEFYDLATMSKRDFRLIHPQSEVY